MLEIKNYKYVIIYIRFIQICLFMKMYSLEATETMDLKNK